VRIGPLIDLVSLGTVQRQPDDFGRRYQPRNVLRIGAPSDALAQVVGDAFGHGLVRQVMAIVLALKPNDMEAVTRFDRIVAEFAGGERDVRPIVVLGDCNPRRASIRGRCERLWFLC